MKLLTADVLPHLLNQMKYVSVSLPRLDFRQSRNLNMFLQLNLASLLHSNQVDCPHMFTKHVYFIVSKHLSAIMKACTAKKT